MIGEGIQGGSIQDGGRTENAPENNHGQIKKRKILGCGKDISGRRRNTNSQKEIDIERCCCDDGSPLWPFEMLMKK